MRLSILAVLACLICPLPGGADTALRDPALPYPQVVEGLRSDRTMADEPLVFPREDASVHALIVSLAPGEVTAWHRHGVPLFAYVLDGAVTVGSGALGTRRYGARTELLEAMDVAHQGRNDGDVPVRILAVYLIGDGLNPTLPARPKAE